MIWKKVIKRQFEVVSTFTCRDWGKSGKTWIELAQNRVIFLNFRFCFVESLDSTAREHPTTFCYMFCNDKHESPKIPNFVQSDNDLDLFVWSYTEHKVVSSLKYTYYHVNNTYGWVGTWVSFQVLWAASIKMAVFCDPAPCCRVENNWRFKKACYLHIWSHYQDIFIYSKY